MARRPDLSARCLNNWLSPAACALFAEPIPVVLQRYWRHARITSPTSAYRCLASSVAAARPLSNAASKDIDCGTPRSALAATLTQRHPSRRNDQ